MNTSSWNSIIYYCGKGVISWDPEDKSLGGSEQAVVQLSERWAKMKYIVQVYGDVPDKVVNGVSYHNYQTFDPTKLYNIFIIWRECALETLGLQRPYARVVLLDLHDATIAIKIAEIQPYVNRTMVKSEYHASLYKTFLDRKKTVVIPNGIQMNSYLELEKKNIKREPLRFCYTASYDRGLKELLQYSWDDIHRQLPGSELHVYYGIAAWDPQKDSYEALLKKKGVVHHGRQSNSAVAEEKFRCSLNLYPSHAVTEIDCINVRESTLAGCIPVLSNMAVFAERDGVHLMGDCSKPEFHKNYVTLVVNLAKEPQKQEEMRRILRKSPLIFSWDPVAEKWHDTFQEELLKFRSY
jgi:glycosyltransferase involved in cell wall biosynthesis